MREQDLVPIVNRLRAQHTDDEFVEVKASASELQGKIWQSVSAFANTAGELIILGLDEDDNFRPVKHFAIDKVLDQFITGMGDGDPNGSRVAQPPIYHPHRYSFEGQPLCFRRELPPVALAFDGKRGELHLAMLLLQGFDPVHACDHSQQFETNCLLLNIR